MIEYTETENKLRQFASEYEMDVKNYLRQQGHEGKGDLEDSIHVSFVKKTDGYSFKLEARNYIQYLEHGDFLINIQRKASEKVKDILTSYIAKDVINDLKRIKTENIY